MLASLDGFLLQNALATLPMVLIMVVSNETRVFMTSRLPTAGIVALVLSCVGGIGMSYFSFALRAAISATTFSVIGNICKVLTILVNSLMWDQHASKQFASLGPNPMTFNTSFACCAALSHFIII